MSVQPLPIPALGGALRRTARPVEEAPVPRPGRGLLWSAMAVAGCWGAAMITLFAVV